MIPRTSPPLLMEVQALSMYGPIMAAVSPFPIIISEVMRHFAAEHGPKQPEISVSRQFSLTPSRQEQRIIFRGIPSVISIIPTRGIRRGMELTLTLATIMFQTIALVHQQAQVPLFLQRDHPTEGLRESYKEFIVLQL